MPRYQCECLPLDESVIVQMDTGIRLRQIGDVCPFYPISLVEDTILQPNTITRARTGLTIKVPEGHLVVVRGLPRFRSEFTSALLIPKMYRARHGQFELFLEILNRSRYPCLVTRYPKIAKLSFTKDRGYIPDLGY